MSPVVPVNPKEVQYDDKYQIAKVYAQWGDADNAMSWLERGYNIRDPGLQDLGNDEMFLPSRMIPASTDSLGRYRHVIIQETVIHE